MYVHTLRLNNSFLEKPRGIDRALKHSKYRAPPPVPASTFGTWSCLYSAIQTRLDFWLQHLTPEETESTCHTVDAELCDAVDGRRMLLYDVNGSEGSGVATMDVNVLLVCVGPGHGSALIV